MGESRDGVPHVASPRERGKPAVAVVQQEVRMVKRVEVGRAEAAIPDCRTRRCAKDSAKWRCASSGANRCVAGRSEKLRCAAVGMTGSTRRMPVHDGRKVHLR